MLDDQPALIRERGCSGLHVRVLGRAAAAGFYEGRGCVLLGYGLYQIGEQREPAREYRLAL